MNKPQYESFATDCLHAEHGHTVIRLPPYHPDLNPIDKIWGIVKARIAAKNVTFKLGDVQQMANAAVTMGEWAAVCRHVKAVEEEYMSREHEMDSVMERIITPMMMIMITCQNLQLVVTNGLILLLISRLTMLLGSLSYVFTIGSNAA
jgi:hypothetical protein